MLSHLQTLICVCVCACVWVVLIRLIMYCLLFVLPCLWWNKDIYIYIISSTVAIRNGVAGPGINTPLRHMCYHAEFDCCRWNRVCMIEGPKILNALGPRPLQWGILLEFGRFRSNGTSIRTCARKLSSASHLLQDVDKPRDTFVQMQWRGWPNHSNQPYQRYENPPEKLITLIRTFKVTLTDL